MSICASGRGFTVYCITLCTPGYCCICVRTQSVCLGIEVHVRVLYAMHPHCNDQNVCVSWAMCMRFAWRQCADTEGKRVVNAMGYIDRP